jgi:hypothetical protein
MPKIFAQLKRTSKTMPVSIDPQPADDEIECGRCGAYIYHGLTRCPNCGVNLYEPEEDFDRDHRLIPVREGVFDRLNAFLRRLTKHPYPVDDLFGAAINQAGLYNDLLNKVGGDPATVERLIKFESQRMPNGNRLIWLENAIHRWEQDNRSSSGKV